MTPKGCYTALITPFKEGNLDEHALVRLIHHQIEGGIDGLVLCGSTGELSLLADEEYKTILKIGTQTVNGKCCLIAGVGSPSTHKALQQAKIAQELGVQGLLVVTPYYVKPTQNGVFEHFKIIHDHTHLPIIVYSNPGRTGFEIDEALLERLMTLERIIGLKDSPTQSSSRIEKFGKRFENSDFTYICGDDAFIGSFVENNAQGWISVVSNLYPNKCTSSFEKRDADMLDEVKAHISAIAVQSPNPVHIKYAVSSVLGLCEEDVRLPLVPLSLEEKQKIDQGLKR